MKKLLISLLCVIMVVCFMPTMAFATETTQPTTDADPAPAENVAKIGETGYPTLAAAAQAAVSGNTINLLTDITNAGAISLPARVTLDGTKADGGNYTISGDSSIHVNAGGGTITNVKFENIHNNADATAEQLVKYNLDSKKGTLSAIYASKLTGKVTITGCTFDNIDWDAIQIVPTAETAEIEIRDNIFLHTNPDTTQLRHVHVEHKNPSNFGSIIAELTITDNQFYSSENSYKTTSIFIGYISNETAKLQVSGNYIEDISTAQVNFGLGVEDLYPRRETPEDEDDKLVGAAKVDGKIFDKLQSAIDAPVDNPVYDHIYLNSDVNENVVFSEKGYEIVFSPGKLSYSGVITNNGNLKIHLGSNTEGTGTINNYGNLTLNCAFAASCNIENYGTVTITNGATYDLNNKINNHDNGKITIKGGTFTTEPADSMIAEGYIARPKDNNTYIVELMTEEEATARGLVAICLRNGRNKAPYFKSITDAMNKGPERSVSLLKDTNEDVVINPNSNEDRGLYLNGHKLTGSLTLQNTCTNLKIYNGTINLNNVTGNKLTIGSSTSVVKATIQDADLNKLDIGASGDCTVEGGNYQAVTIHVIYETKENVTPQYTGRLSLEGGTFGSNIVTIDYLRHPNGTATQEVPIADYLAPGYKLITNEDGTYTVSCGDDNHTASQDWKYDESKHWHECEKCKIEMTPANHTFNWVVDKNATSTEKGSKHEECTVCGYQKAAVEIPATGVSIPTGPSTPADNVTNQPATQGTGTTEPTAPTTTANMSSTTTVKTESKVDAATGETKNVVTSTTTIDNTTAEKIVDKAVANKSEEVIIDTTTSTPASTEAAQVGIPTATLEAISEKTSADVTVKTDVAEVTMDNKTAGEIAEQATGTTVHIVAEKTKENANKVEFELKVVDSNGTVISEFNGGNVSVTVKVPAVMKDKKLVCVYIADNGKVSKVKGQKNDNDTFTFITGHFSAYAIMTEEEADAAIGAQVEELVKGLADIDLVARSVRTSKGNVKVTLKVDKEGQALIDEIKEAGYTVKYNFYRSTKKGAGYVSKMLKGTKTYTNTYGKKGTMYYYKARVQVYDAEGKLIAKTALKDCKYASRLWKK